MGMGFGWEMDWDVLFAVEADIVDAMGVFVAVVYERIGLIDWS